MGFEDDTVYSHGAAVGVPVHLGTAHTGFQSETINGVFLIQTRM